MPPALTSRLALFSLPLAFVCLGVAPARAADPALPPTPERALVAENAVRDFMSNMLGTSVRVGDKPIHLQPDGDHYDASALLGPGQQATAQVREGAAGVWTFDTLRTPNPAQFTVTLPSPVPNRPDARITYDLKAAEQDGAGSVDSTLATPSTMTASVRALDVTMTSAERTSTSHVGRGTSTIAVRPGAGDTVDLLNTSALADYSIVASAATNDLSVSLRLDADTIEAKSTLEGVSREKGPALLRSVVATVANNYAAMAAGAAPGKPFDPAPARALVQGLDGFATAMTIDQAATRLRGVVNGFSFAVDRARLGIEAHSSGTLEAGMEIEADGLSLPALASNPFAPFIPSKFEIHPSVSGVNTHDLLAAITAGLDPNRPPGAGPPPEFLALLSQPGLAAEINAFEVDIGTSVLTGKGKVGAPVPGQFGGAGQVAITGFDALTDKVKTLPQASQVLPVMLFAKGIGRTEGDRLVWDVTYDAGKLLVNGIDVLAMAGGGRR